MHSEKDLDIIWLHCLLLMASPAWLQRWLRIPFYEEKCSKHVHKYNTVFCIVCMGETACEVCWKDESERHQGHPILQVFTASRRSAVMIEDIKRLWDVSRIQPYIINFKNIVHLHPSTLGGALAQNENHPFCQTCKRKIKEFNYSFCSIACKNKDMQRTISTEMEETSPIIVESHERVQPATIKRKRADCCAVSLRMRSRKGIPQRAHLK